MVIDSDPTYYVFEFTPTEDSVLLLSLQLVMKITEKSFLYFGYETTTVTPISEPAIFNTEGKKIILLKMDPNDGGDEKNIFIQYKCQTVQYEHGKTYLLKKQEEELFITLSEVYAEGAIQRASPIEVKNSGTIKYHRCKI